MRVKRVPDEEAKRIMQRLEREGYMPFLIAMLEDRQDRHNERLKSLLSAEILSKPEELALFQARQGALAEVGDIIAEYKTLARRKAAPDARRLRRRAPVPRSAL